MGKVKVLALILVSSYVSSLVSGYGVNYSTVIEGEGFLTCKYVWAKGVFKKEYFYAENGFLGRRACPFINN